MNKTSECATWILEPLNGRADLRGKWFANLAQASKKILQAAQKAAYAGLEDDGGSPQEVHATVSRQREQVRFNAALATRMYEQRKDDWGNELRAQHQAQQAMEDLADTVRQVDELHLLVEQLVDSFHSFDAATGGPAR